MQLNILILFVSVWKLKESAKFLVLLFAIIIYKDLLPLSNLVGKEKEKRKRSVFMIV